MVGREREQSRATLSMTNEGGGVTERKTRYNNRQGISEYCKKLS